MESLADLASPQKLVRSEASIGSLFVKEKRLQRCLPKWELTHRYCAGKKCVFVVKCEQLRPDLDWVRIADKRWPWHRKGRPVLDVAKAVA